MTRLLRKLRRIATSDLETFDKLRYALNRTRRGADLVKYRLRGGRAVTLRRGTTDIKVFDEIFIEQAYAPCVAALPEAMGPVALIDLGANIGLSALFLSRALDVVEIIAVEPDPDNLELLEQNLSPRSTTIRAFAGAENGFAELYDSGNGAWGMRMGPNSTAGIPVLPLAEIAAAATTGAPVVLKCDIEGGDRELFFHIRDWDHLIPYVLLELHIEFLSLEELFACLESSHFQWTIHGKPPSGASIVLLTLERGGRR